MVLYRAEKHAFGGMVCSGTKSVATAVFHREGKTANNISKNVCVCGKRKKRLVQKAEAKKTGAQEQCKRVEQSSSRKTPLNINESTRSELSHKRARVGVATRRLEK